MARKAAVARASKRVADISVAKQASFFQPKTNRADDAREELEQYGLDDTMQSMEQLIGGQMQEVWAQLQHMYATTIKLLEYRDTAARSAEIEVSKMTADLDAMRSKSKDVHESRNVAMVAAQCKALKQDLLQEHKVARALETENFELREQLAALQAVGSFGLQGAGIPLPGEEEQPECGPEGAPTLLSEPPSPVGWTAAQPVRRALVRPTSAPGQMGKSLERLERAQLKLDKWAIAEAIRPPAVTTGLVTPEEVRGLPLPQTPSVRKKASDGGGGPEKAVGRTGSTGSTAQEEDKDSKADGDDFTWEYTRAKKWQTKRSY